jgi:hypothetical protein
MQSALSLFVLVSLVVSVSFAGTTWTPTTTLSVGVPTGAPEARPIPLPSHPHGTQCFYLWRTVVWITFRRCTSFGLFFSPLVGLRDTFSFDPIPTFYLIPKK